MTFGHLLQTALPWIWVGAVLAISFLETPLKFRAPGITVPLGLGIGRLVFRALNRVEAVLAVVITIAVLTGDADPTGVVIALVVAWLALIAKAAIVRPRLGRRTDLVVAGEDPGPSHLHLVYIALELVTVVAVGALGVLTLDALLP